MFGYYHPGEKRIHRVVEADLRMLYNAGLTLIQLEYDGVTGRYGRMRPEVKVELERAVQRARESIESREKYG